MAISVPQVAVHIASSLLIGATVIVISGIVAFFVARKYGGRSRRRREMIFLLVGAFGLLVAGGLVFLRLQFRA